MPRPKQDKVKLTLTVNKNVLDRAKQLIPNLSAFVETKLREFIILAEHGLTFTPGEGLEPSRPYGQGISNPPQCLSATPAFEISF